MTMQEDIAAADWEGQNFPGLIKLQRDKAVERIRELRSLIQRIKGKGGNVDDLLEQMEAIIQEGREHDPYQNLR